ILAKVARDARMVELDAEAPEYCWASNKGYGSKPHREAIDRFGVHAHHRRSWRLGSAPVARTAAPEPVPASATTAPQRSVLHAAAPVPAARSEEHTSELQSRFDLVCRLL